ncbi:MAG: hypothetical protein ACK41P_08535 [Asticcacaulis sp.]
MSERDTQFYKVQGLSLPVRGLLISMVLLMAFAVLSALGEALPASGASGPSIWIAIVICTLMAALLLVLLVAMPISTKWAFERGHILCRRRQLWGRSVRHFRRRDLKAMKIRANRWPDGAETYSVYLSLKPDRAPPLVARTLVFDTPDRATAEALKLRFESDLKDD